MHFNMCFQGKNQRILPHRWAILLAVLLTPFFMASCTGGGSPRADNMDPQMSWPYNPGQWAGQEGKFYINGQNEGYVTVFDANSQEKLKQINFWEHEMDRLRREGKPVDDKAIDFIQKNMRPHHSWITPGGKYNYVSNNSKGSNRMWVVDTRTDEIIATIDGAGMGPLHGAFSPFRDLAAFGTVQDRKQGWVTFIDLNTHKVIGQAKTTGIQTRDLVFTPDNKHLYVTNSGWNPKKGIMGGVDMIDIDTHKVVKSFDIPGSRGMKMTYDGKLVGVASIRKGFVAFIDTATHKVIAKVDVGNQPNNISFSPDNSKAYVGIRKDKVFVVIDLKTFTVKTKIPAGKNANAMYLAPGNSGVGIGTNEADDFVTVIDYRTDRKIKEIDTPLGPHNVAYTPDGKIAIISCAKSREAIFIDMETLEEIVVIDKAGHGNNGVRWAPYASGLSSAKPY